MHLGGTLDSIDLTTLARVRATIPQSVNDTSADARISQFISDVSAQIGRHLGFHLSTVTDRAEVYLMRKHQNVLRLDAKPLTGVSSVKYTSSTPDDWSTIAALSDSNYLVHNAGGFIRFLTPRINDPGICQVTYTGGFGAATANVVADHPDLALACDLQVKYLNERLNALGGDVTTIPGAGTSFAGQYNLLQSVHALLGQFRRGSV